MKFKKQLIHGRLLRRYKRFLADVILDDGTEVVAHCTNSGTMLSCLEEGAEVWLTPVDDPKRRTQFTWEMIKIGGDWVGINTSNPNALAKEWVGGGLVPGLEGLTGLRREVKWEDSRFDLYGELSDNWSADRSEGRSANEPGSEPGREPGREPGHEPGREPGMEPGRACFIEVKNVTLKEGDRALFPDAVSERGRKHLNTQARVSPESIEYHRLMPVEL